MAYNNNNVSAIKCFVLLTALVSLFGSCKKFLAETPTGSMTDLTTYSTAADGAALTIGPYRSLATWIKGAGDWGNYLPATLE